jgi:hypothetical protein
LPASRPESSRSRHAPRAVRRALRSPYPTRQSDGHQSRRPHPNPLPVGEGTAKGPLMETCQALVPFRCRRQKHDARSAEGVDAITVGQAEVKADDRRAFCQENLELPEPSRAVTKPSASCSAQWARAASGDWNIQVSQRSRLSSCLTCTRRISCKSNDSHWPSRKSRTTSCSEKM